VKERVHLNLSLSPSLEICASGTSNAADVYSKDPKFSSAAQRLAVALNLKPHKVKEVMMYGPFDCEGHVTSDGRLYMLDFARLFPCEALSNGISCSISIFLSFFSDISSYPLLSPSVSFHLLLTMKQLRQLDHTCSVYCDPNCCRYEHTAFLDWISQDTQLPSISSLR
jgi:hypothetical protein